MKSIMFICTGNVCRSPVAHGYMQKKVYDLNRQNEFIISSCGTRAITGQPATYNTIKAVQKYDVDLTKHRATHIDDTDIINYDLIITLTNEHKKDVIRNYPNLVNKVYTLKEYVKNEDGYIDIDDPWGLDIKVYNATAKEIVYNIDKLLEII